MRAPGRWHNSGLPIVYLAEGPAGALLEVCVHTSANDIPPQFTLLEIEVKEHVALEVLDKTTLHRNWTKDLEATRNIGSAWLQSGRSTLLRVPSALVPATFNVVLNPAHPGAAQLRITSVYRYPFDRRIKK